LKIKLAEGRLKGVRAANFSLLRIQEMINYERLLLELFQKEKINLKNGEVFRQSKCIPDVGFDRIEGMILGLCIGDSLGNSRRVSSDRAL
jgi:hypothetical protein